MKIETLKVGYLETNCYLLSIGDDVLVIDPGDEAERIIKTIGKRKVVGIVVTHYHFDHTEALGEIEKYTSAKIYDIYNLGIGKNRIGKFAFECIRTPGHKEDLISLYFKEENSLFCGDFIFKGTIGRWDLEGGYFKDMVESIKHILTYPWDMKIYPGHGEMTSLGEEKDNLEKYLK